jgi:CysZ protein
MIRAFALALGQLGDPALRRPLLLSLAIAALLYAALWAGLYFLLSHTQIFDIGWLETAIDALGGIAVVVLTAILFPGVAAAIVSLFLDSVVEAVERRHYPELKAPPPARPGRQLVMSARLLAAVIVFNLLALPFYLVPVLNIVVFAGLNGYLLGREYAEMVGPRRLDAPQWARLWRRRRVRFVSAGIIFALLSTIPLVNFVAPVVAAATMTHLIETARREIG